MGCEGAEKSVFIGFWLGMGWGDSECGTEASRTSGGVPPDVSSICGSVCDVEWWGAVVVVENDVVASFWGRFIIAGAGDASRSVVGRLGSIWDVLGVVVCCSDDGRARGVVAGVCDVAATVWVALGEAGVAGPNWGFTDRLGSVCRRL